MTVPAGLLAGKGSSSVAVSDVWAVRGAPAASWKLAERAIPGAVAFSADGLPASWIILKVGTSRPRPVITNAVDRGGPAGRAGHHPVGRRPRAARPGRPLCGDASVGGPDPDRRPDRQEALPFQTQVTVSADLASGETKVITPGRSGSALRTYRITYRNGTEIRRTLLDEQVLERSGGRRAPAGAGPRRRATGPRSASRPGTTARRKGDFAAHLTLPKGTTVTVTNTDTGATVSVVINDRGPYGIPGRIIDLCSTAFAQIAPLGQGVANVSDQLVIPARPPRAR